MTNILKGTEYRNINGFRFYFQYCGANSFVWSNNINWATARVAPTNTTTYSATVTKSNVCKYVDTVVVTVNPLPLVDAGNDETICKGDNYELRITNYELGVNYQWSIPLTTPNFTGITFKFLPEISTSSSTSTVLSSFI